MRTRTKTIFSPKICFFPFLKFSEAKFMNLKFSVYFVGLWLLECTPPFSKSFLILFFFLIVYYYTTYIFWWMRNKFCLKKRWAFFTYCQDPYKKVENAQSSFLLPSYKNFLPINTSNEPADIFWVISIAKDERKGRIFAAGVLSTASILYVT